MFRTIATLAVSMILISGCARTTDGPSTADARRCVEKFDPATYYFPEKTTLEFAVNLSVDYRKSYKVVTVRRPSENGAPEQYVLLQCGAPRPELSGDLVNA